jgi:hypothetical protein
MFEEFRLLISLRRARSRFPANHSVEYRANSLIASLAVRLRSCAPLIHSCVRAGAGGDYEAISEGFTLTAASVLDQLAPGRYAARVAW